MFRIDMHVHTSLGGDSDIRPEELVELAILAGLNGICVVEHHSYSFSEPLSALSDKDGVLIIRGLEYHGAEGHLLIFGYPGTQGDLPRGLPLQYVMDLVNLKGGIAIPAHPFQKGLVGSCLGNRIFDLKGLVAIETENGSLSEDENLLAKKAANRMGLFGIGGSDAHGPRVLGRAYTIFPRPINGPLDLIEALKEGGYYPERKFHHSSPYLL